jgi:tetratricopeptide (TPR) repeat protein
MGTASIVGLAVIRKRRSRWTARWGRPVAILVWAFLLIEFGPLLPRDAGAAAPKVIEKAAGRWALLIGVDDYAEAEKLHYCGADMRDLRDQLVKSGFPKEQVFLLTDEVQDTKYRPLKVNIERQLELVLGLVERDDLIVVGFSGHGVHIDGKSYLCPTETRLGDAHTMVSLDGVYERLQKCPAAFKLLLVDACRNDPRVGGQKSLTPTAQTSGFAASLERPPEGILLLSSCAPGQVSMEEKEFGHGVFMHFVLEGLQGKADDDHNGRVSLMELYKYANRQTKTYVARKFNGYQTPSLKGDIADDFDLANATQGTESVTAVQRGQNYYTQANYTQAIAAFSEAIQLDPKNKPAWQGRGKSKLWAGQYDAAIADFDEALRLDEKDSSSYNWRGYAYQQKKDLDRAVADYDQAIRLLPTNDEALNDRGWVRYLRGDYDGAIADFNQALQLNGKSSFYHNNRGEAYYAKRDYDTAVADYSDAIRLAPNSPQGYYNRGWTYSSQKKYDLAIADLTQAIRLNPNSANYYIKRGDAYYYKNDFDTAVADYSESVRLAPDSPDGYFNRGWTYSDQGKYDLAIADLTQAIRRNPKNASYYNSRGVAHYRKNEFDAAIADYSEAIRINPNFVVALSNRGAVYRQKGLDAQATADEQRVRQLHPEH